MTEILSLADLHAPIGGDGAGAVGDIARHAEVLYPNIRIGTGVIVQHVQRVREMMLEQRINANTGDFARLDTLRQQLQHIEGLLMEPGEQGIGGDCMARSRVVPACIASGYNALLMQESR